MPLLWLSLAFLLGISLGKWLAWSLTTWALLAVCFLALIVPYIVFRRRSPSAFTLSLPSPDGFPPYALPIPLLLLVVVLGGLRYQLVLPRPDPGWLAWYNDSPEQVIVQGLLAAPPDERDGYALLRLDAEQISLPDQAIDQSVRGLLLASVAPGGGWSYGDRLRLAGTLVTPPSKEEFSYRDYLARQGVYSYMPSAQVSLVTAQQGVPFYAWIYRLRARALYITYQLFPDPQASLLAGVLLGVDTGIPPDVQQAFRDTGTSHIIAISGFNMTIIAGLMAGGFARLWGNKGAVSARKAALASLLGIALYTLLVGAAPSVVRAAIMAGVAIFAVQLGRRQAGLNTLLFVAALMVAFNPHYLWDVGFQLSFMATLGLVLFAAPFTATFLRLASRLLPPPTAQRLARPVGEYFLYTLAATLTILPITIYYFGQLSWTALLANPLILPAQPPLMSLGGIAVSLGLLSQSVGQVAAYLALPFLTYTILIAEWLASLPGDVLYFGRIGPFVIVLYYLFLFGLAFRRPTSPAPQNQPAPPASQSRLSLLKDWLVANRTRLFLLGLAALTFLAFLAWRAALSAPDGRLHLTVLDVGRGGSSGEALLIQSPTGRYLLVNGGPSSLALSDALGRRLPSAPGVSRRLDVLVVAGSDDGQLAGLPSNLERFLSDQVLWAGPSGASASARQVRAILAQNGIPITDAATGQILELGDGARLHILSANPRGAVLLLEWGSFRALLPIGLDFTALEALQADPTLTPVTALLLSSSGYAPANPPAWIAKLHPQLVLLSVAPGDRRNLPDPETLLAVQGYPLLRTDLNGWIELITDGEQMWVEVEK